MKGKYTPVLVLLPIFLLVIYVYWSAYFQNMLNSRTAHDVPFGSTVQLENDDIRNDNLAILHFYDPSCLVAQDNIEHLKLLADRFRGKEASWYIIINKEVDLKPIQQALGFEAQWVIDKDSHLASALGVTNTPKLVILDKDQLYFRGSYVKNGAFCGANDIASSDAGVAFRSIMKGNQLPVYLKDRESYLGCSL